MSQCLQQVQATLGTHGVNKIITSISNLVQCHNAHLINERHLSVKENQQKALSQVVTRLDVLQRDDLVATPNAILGGAT